MFFDIALKAGLILNAVSIVSNAVLCFLKSSNKYEYQLRLLAKQCRWGGVIYFVFAWFMGDGSILASGRNTFSEVAYMMQTISLYWLGVFLLTLFCKIWISKDNMSKTSLITAICYFVIAFLIH